MKYKYYTLIVLFIFIAFMGCNIKKNVLEVVYLDTYQKLDVAEDSSKISALVDVITEQKYIKFSSNNFYIRVKLNNPVNEEHIKENIRLNQSLKYSIHNFSDETFSNEWGILPLNWKIGDKGVFSIMSKNDDIKLTLEMVESPVVINTQIISPMHRYNQQLNMPLQKAYLLSDSKVRITFNKAMDKGSVTALISKAVINSNYKVNCTWESTTSLIIQFFNAPEKELSNININLTGAKDTDGVSLIDSNGLVLYLVSGKSVSIYNYNNELLYQLTNNYNICNIALSLNGDLLVCSDILSEQYSKRYKAIYNNLDLRLINIENYSTIFEKSLTSLGAINNLKWSNSSFFFFKDTLYNKKGEQLHLFNDRVIDIAFSQDENRLALLVENENEELAIHIYDLINNMLIKQVELNNDVSKSFISYLDSNSIIYERNYNIKLYNLNNKTERTLLRGSVSEIASNNLISPDKTMMIYELLNGNIAIYSFKTGRIIYTFASNITPKYFVWSADSTQLAYSVLPKKQIKVLNLSNKSNRTLPLYGWPLGWDRNGNIVICN